MNAQNKKSHEVRELSSPEFKLNSDSTVAVATEVYLNSNMGECPRGAKVQLLGEGGVLAYGTYDGKDSFWTAWAPLPKRRPLVVDEEDEHLVLTPWESLYLWVHFSWVNFLRRTTLYLKARKTMLLLLVVVVVVMWLLIGAWGKEE